MISPYSFLLSVALWIAIGKGQKERERRRKIGFSRLSKKFPWN